MHNIRPSRFLPGVLFATLVFVLITYAGVTQQTQRSPQAPSATSSDTVDRATSQPYTGDLAIFESKERDRNWLKQYQYPSPEFTLHGLLLWFILPGNSSNSRGRAVPVALVRNPSTPAALLKQLQIQLTQPLDKAVRYDNDCDILLAVAFNPHTSETQRIEYLQQALPSDWNHILENIAKNPITLVSILEQIAQRGANGIHNVAKNPNVPVNILKASCSTG